MPAIEQCAVLEEALGAYRMDPGLALHRAAEALLLRRLNLGGPVLDLGCHDGAFASLALRSTALRTRVVGSDRDLTGLAQCRARRLHCSVVAADAAQLPFADRSFGAVVCNSVLAHIDELPAAMREISRVLALGGLLAATVPTPAFHSLFAPERALRLLGLRRAARNLGASYDRNWHQRNFLSEDEWRALLAGAGLQLDTWTEYLGPRGSLVWSALFVLTRAGAGRVTIGALLRRLFPSGAAWTRWLERLLSKWLLPALQAQSPGGSALLLARRCLA
jgi:SAM-dependent methyltransferase